LLPGSVHRLGFCRAQFGAVTVSPSVLAGGYITLAFRGGRITRFCWRQFGSITGLHPVIAVGHITLVIGHRQGNRFRFTKL
jgi:hypothetical protein